MRAAFIAFSMYSRIPMPILEYTQEDMRYTFLAFPLVGVVIAALEYGWFLICVRTGIGTSLYAALAAAIPVCITTNSFLSYSVLALALLLGGLVPHRVQVLKDSHVGAFAVIWTGLYLLVSYGLFTELREKQEIIMVAIGFVLSRATSGLAAISFPSASGKSSLAYFAKAGDRKVKTGLWIWIIVTCVSFICYDIRYGVTVIVVLAMWFLHYNRMSKREFGGITGDLAGWYVETCELAVLGAAVVLAYILRICGI